jgi:hypothetical protein
MEQEAALIFPELLWKTYFSSFTIKAAYLFLI